MTEYKQLICGFGCQGSQLFHLGSWEPFHLEAADICRHASDNGADQLFILDRCETEDQHQQMIGTLKEIASKVDIPIITGGWIKRFEDIKKYLYAGASAVFLDVSIDEHVDLIKEASSRFGSEAIYAYLPDAGYCKRVKEYEQLGASKIMVKDLCDKEDFSAFPDSLPVLAFSRVDSGGQEGIKKAADNLSGLYRIPAIQGAILYALPCEAYMDMKQALKETGLLVDTFESSIGWEAFKTNGNGLIPVIVQDYKTDQVLMMAYMNQEAFQKTLETGKMTYYSRSRKTLWLKGETSGHFQYVKSLSLDCDNDTILAKVHQIGAACHTGNRSCFFKTLAAKAYKETNPLKVFEEEYAIIQDRKEHPKEGSYTNYLFDKGIDKILKKCGEEATEIIIAAKNPDPEEIKYEIADFLYHMMVLMVEKGVTWEEITKEVANR